MFVYNGLVYTMDFKCCHELILIKFETQKFHFDIPAPD